MLERRAQAVSLDEKITNEYGINLLLNKVAVSMLRHTQETAIVAGFRWLHAYPRLNEEKGGLSDSNIRRALHERNLLEATSEAAQI